MNKDKILEIFKKNSVYTDSEAFIRDIEMDAEDENGDSLIYDEEFIVEDVGSYMNDYIQHIKLDFVKELIKEAQIEILEELWHTTSDFGQKKRYELIYDRIVEKLNELKNENNKL